MRIVIVFLIAEIGTEVWTGVWQSLPNFLRAARDGRPAPRRAAFHLSRMAGSGVGVGNARFHRKIIGCALPRFAFGCPARCRGCHRTQPLPIYYSTEAARLL